MKEYCDNCGEETNEIEVKLMDEKYDFCRFDCMREFLKPQKS